MNKKFLSAILFGALTVASTGSFVSCKDYDDDIDNLQTQINGLASAKDLSDKVANLQSQIASAQSAAEAKAAAAQAVAEAAKAAAEKAQADAKAANDAAVAAADAAAKALEAAVAALTNDINDVKGAQAAAEEAYKKSVEDLKTADEAVKAALTESMDAAIADVKASISELAGAVAANKADIEQLKKDLEAAKTEAAKAAAEAKSLAEKAATDAKAAVDDVLAKLEEAKKDADKKAQDAAAAAKQAQDAVEALAKVANQEELEKIIAAAAEAQKAADKANDAAKDLEEKLADYAKTSDLDAAIAALDINAIKKRIAAIEAENLANRVEKLEEAVAGAASQKSVENLTAMYTTLDEQYKDLCAKLGIISKRLTSVVFAPTSYINGIEAIKFVDLKYRDWGTNPENWLNDDATEADYKVGGKARNIKVDDFGAKVEYMVSPDGVTMDGIKGIPTFVLNGATNTRAQEDGTAEAADVELSFIEKPTIEKGKLVGYVKKTLKNDATKLPSKKTNNNVSEDLIVASLKTLIAEDLKTDAEKETEVAVYSDWTRIAEEDGKPLIHMKGASLTAKDRHFSNYSDIYGCKRASDELIEKNSEKKGPDAVFEEVSGVEISMLYSSPVDLKNLVTVCNEDKSVIEDYARYGLEFEFHMLDYKVLNLNATKKDDFTNQSEFAKLEGDILTASYNGKDFNKVVIGRTPVIQVVLKDKNNNAVVDVCYLKIKWTDKIIETNIWDEPFANAVAWRCPETSQVGKKNKYTDNYVAYIVEEDMDKFFSEIVTGGIEKSVFYTLYNSLSDIYLGELTQEKKDQILAGDDSELTKIGTAYWATDNTVNSADAQTHNIKLHYTFVNPRVDDENPADGEDLFDPSAKEDDFTKEGFFCFISTDKTNRIFVPVTLNVKAGSYKYNADKETTMWNAAQNQRVMNPQVYSNETYGLDKSRYGSSIANTQMIASLNAGYIMKNGSQPTITSLVKHVDAKNVTAYKQGSSDVEVSSINASGKIVFDEDKIGALPTRMTTAKYGTPADYQPCVWYLDASKKQLFNAYIHYDANNNPIYEEDLLAAVIDNDGNIFLTDYDNMSYTTGWSIASPNAASLLLVGQELPVKVVAHSCHDYDVDSYTVKFLKPLKFNGLNNEIHVYDIVPGGSTAKISLGNICLQENFGAAGSKIYIYTPQKPQLKPAPKLSDYNNIPGLTDEDKATLLAAAEEEYKEVVKKYNQDLIAYNAAVTRYKDPENQKLLGWYGVGSFNPSTDLATTGGVLLSSIKNKAGNGPKYNLVFNAATGEITFNNVDGSSMQQDLTIEIPVGIDTKWQKSTDLNGVITVIIHATAIK